MTTTPTLSHASPQDDAKAVAALDTEYQAAVKNKRRGDAVITALLWVKGTPLILTLRCFLHGVGRACAVQEAYQGIFVASLLPGPT